MCCSPIIMRLCRRHCNAFVSNFVAFSSRFAGRGVATGTRRQAFRVASRGDWPWDGGSGGGPPLELIELVENTLATPV